MIKKTNVMAICLVFMLTSCTYLKYSAIQSEYKKLQNADPSQVNYKHMLDKETFFILGKSLSQTKQYANVAMAITAYSSKFKRHERVDTMFFEGTGTHYGLNLPGGTYTLLIYADLNNDNQFSNAEIVANKELVLDPSTLHEKMVKHIDMHITQSTTISWAETIQKPDNIMLEQSLYFPSGSIRSLDDPLFDDNISTMGMYDPASFLKYAPTAFYALEEDKAHKIPVIFVHGIGGSSRSFKTIIDNMDKNRYQAWFFYYPSGGDLDQLADLFYDIFLSGSIVARGKMPMIVVAHSMGGLIAREAFNNYQGKEIENKVELFVSMASPFGGHPSAASGEKHGLIVLPSWQDLNPANQFINELYRKPLPSFVNHQLFYAYNNADMVKLGENSDGVVPLSSQLHPDAQRQSRNQFGFNQSHVDILNHEQMIVHLLEQMAGVNNIFPESHMEILLDGGFNVELSDTYSPFSKHLISYAGKYLVLLCKGIITPISPQQERLVQAVQGKIAASHVVHREFIQFMKEYPELVNRVLAEQKH